MQSILEILHWVAAIVVLAEGLNKLERTAPFRPGICTHDRIVDGLKALAWCLLALGAGGAVIAPVLPLLGVDQLAAGTMMRVDQLAAGTMMRVKNHTLAETAVMLGFAVLIMHTRIKEG